MADLARIEAALAALHSAPRTAFTEQAQRLLDLFDLMDDRERKADLIAGRLSLAYAAGVCFSNADATHQPGGYLDMMRRPLRKAVR